MIEHMTTERLRRSLELLEWYGSPSESHKIRVARVKSELERRDLEAVAAEVVTPQRKPTRRM
jgi:hypothetical protein